MERIQIFDTTLRDGEQAPGFTMRLPEKLQLARALALLGVDVIEAGFPAASPEDAAAVKAVAQAVRGPEIAGLARCVPGDIDAAWEALQGAARPRIHVFLATSEIHRTHKLKMGTGKVLQSIESGVSRARSVCERVEFSPEDASRTERSFLREVVAAAIEAGATVINVPDTVGYTLPTEFEELFRWLQAEVPGAGAVTFSAHCHDDLGLATANSLAAIRGGARQVECTVNGIGERAGNAALEEVVMALRTREAAFGAETGIDTTRLVGISRLLSRVTGVAAPPNKAIVGRNAFAHEAGIHQHGVLEHAATYEIMSPESVGFDGERLVLGKHSGRHALRARLEALGLEVDEAAFPAFFQAFKELADVKSQLHDADLEVLLLQGTRQPAGPWSLDGLQAMSGSEGTATATVRLSHETAGQVHEAATGDGPIHATFRALMRACGQEEGTLSDFQVHSVTLGGDAQGQVSVECERRGSKFRGVGYSTDIVHGGAQGILDVINQWERASAPGTVDSTSRAQGAGVSA